MDTRYIEYALLKYSGNGEQYIDLSFLQQMKILRNERTAEASLAVKVCSEFLRPLYHEGEILLVRTQPSVRIGELGLFVYRGLGLVMKFGSSELVSVNPYYHNISLDEEFYCKGLVIGVLHENELIQDLGNPFI